MREREAWHDGAIVASMNKDAKTDLDFESGTTRPDSVSTYSEVAARGQALRSLLSKKNIRVHRDSALGVLLRDADRLAKAWDEGDSSERGIFRLLNAAHVNRISEAILMVGDEPGAVEPIRRIAGSDMDLSARSLSHGKNALWELDLLSFLRRRSIDAELIDPPDIVCRFPFGKYAIACKKVYSEKGVEAQMRKGVTQLIPFGGVGLVAFNLDDLAPERTILQSVSQADAADFLAKQNHSFIDRHRSKVQRFIAEGRCDGILVSTTVVSDIVQSRPRFVTYSQATLWSLESADQNVLSRLQTFRQALGID